MKFLITFDGTLLVGFEPHEVEEQADELSQRTTNATCLPP